MNHHNTLGVSANADPSEIQKAFRMAAMEIHPDHSNSPEAAEAFARIKQARDELLKKASAAEMARSDDSIQQSTNAAIRSTTASAFSYTAVDDLFDGMTPEEVEHVQMLDELARAKPQRSLLGKVKESAEVRRHRKKLKTNERRLRGLY